jgi:hypothetical protein
LTRVAAVAVVAALCFPLGAHANGDPASHVLPMRKVFVPLNAEVDSGALSRLEAAVDEADDVGFRIRVALIAEPEDLGTAFALFEKPQRYAELLGSELRFIYDDRLLVVTPKGYGYVLDGNADPQGKSVVARLPAPGADATAEARAASHAIVRLAAAAGHRITIPSGNSATRDRLTIAAAAVLGLAFVGGLLLYRRSGRTLSP